jgi:hypothetical protein
MDEATPVQLPLRTRSGSVTLFALVDAADYERVSQQRWYWDGRYPYTSLPTGKRSSKRVRLHIFLLGDPPAGLYTDHINRDTLDNRRSNLRWLTPRESIRNSNAPPAHHARKTHCPRGHPYSGENLVRGAKGERICRQCRRDLRRAAYRRNGAKQRAQQQVAYRALRERMTPEELARFRAQRAANMRAFRARKREERA